MRKKKNDFDKTRLAKTKRQKKQLKIIKVELSQEKKD